MLRLSYNPYPAWDLALDLKKPFFAVDYTPEYTRGTPEYEHAFSVLEKEFWAIHPKTHLSKNKSTKKVFRRRHERCFDAKKFSLFMYNKFGQLQLEDHFLATLDAPGVILLDRFCKLCMWVWASPTLPNPYCYRCKGPLAIIPQEKAEKLTRLTATWYPVIFKVANAKCYETNS